MPEQAQVSINGAIFSRYECQICCAVKLWIKNADNTVPSDDTLSYIVRRLRGFCVESHPPCQNIVPQIQRHSEEGVRSIYMSVYVNRSHWEREARRVYADSGLWKQNEEIVKRFVPKLYILLFSGVPKTEMLRQIRRQKPRPRNGYHTDQNPL